MRRLIIIVIGLLLISTLLISSVVTTEGGLQWAYRQAQAHLPVGLRIDKLDGKLVGPIHISGIEYEQHGTTIKAAEILLDWHPLSLLTSKINISQLHLQSLEVILPAVEKTAAAAPPALPDIYLPWRTVVSQLEIDGITIRQPQKTILLEKISLDASTLLSNIEIARLTVSADDFSINVQGNLHAAGNYNIASTSSGRQHFPPMSLLRARVN